jgi:antitoxin VapB
MSKTAKVFTNGGSQAVRLPAEFRFSTDEVYVWRDENSGDVVLSAQPRGRWADFVALRDHLRAVPPDFLAGREQSIETRDPIASTR